MLQKISEGLKKFQFYRHGNYRNPFLFNYLVYKSLTQRNFLLSGIQHYINPLVAINLDNYADEENAKILTDDYYQAIKKDENFLENYYGAHYNSFLNILNKAKQIKNQKVKSLTNFQLESTYKEWFETNISNIHWLWGMEFFNLAIDRIVREIVSQKPHLDIEHTLVILAEPSENIGAIQARSVFLEKAALVKEGKKKLNDVVDELNINYAWLGFNTWDGHPMDHKAIEEKISYLMNSKPREELSKIKHEKELNKEKYEKTLDGFSKHEQIFLRFVSRLIYLKSVRIEMLSQSTWHLYNFISETAKRLGISYLDYYLLTPEEIYSLCKQENIDMVKIQKRKQNFALVWLNEKMTDFCGDEIKDVRKAVQPKIEAAKQLKGAIAYRGKVRGPVKVVNNETEIGKINFGDILVAPMTNPNYDPCLNKVIGMIADEGGILTHTAIVAREFKIPTLIGTKIATQVLQDGDIIELNADIGMVTILKKSTDVSLSP